MVLDLPFESLSLKELLAGITSYTKSMTITLVNRRTKPLAGRSLEIRLISIYVDSNDAQDSSYPQDGPNSSQELHVLARSARESRRRQNVRRCIPPPRPE